MELHLAKRHYFTGESGLKELEMRLRDLENVAQHAIRSTKDGTPVHLTLRVSTPSEPMGNMENRVRNALRFASDAGWKVNYNSSGETAGQKFVKQLFRTDSHISPGTDPILALCCLDQYPLHEPEQFDAFVELARKLHTDGNVYANGSRSVPVRLGVSEEAHELRTVHELIHSITPGANFITDDVPAWASPSPWYRMNGESTSGAYFTNPQSTCYPALRNEVLARPALYNKPGFSVEYLTALAAGALGSVTTGYVHAVRNPFPEGIDADTEAQKARALITNSTRDLAGTAVRDALEGNLESVMPHRCIGKFFSAARIEEVAELMRAALRH